MRKRNKRCSLWLNEKEFLHLEKQAKITGFKKEQLIRSLISGIEVRPRPNENISSILRELSAIGNNINQIARKANAFDTVSQAEILEIKKMLADIFIMVKS